MAEKVSFQMNDLAFKKYPDGKLMLLDSKNDWMFCREHIKELSSPASLGGGMGYSYRLCFLRHISQEILQNEWNGLTKCHDSGVLSWKKKKHGMRR